MNRGDLIKRVRAYTRDLSSSIFRNVDIVDFINEGADRVKSRVPLLSTIPTLTNDDATPTPLPSQFHYLLAVFSASRCFSQDERHYQASTLMNEFETKLEEMIGAIQNGDVVIKDALGVPIVQTNVVDYVTQVYFKKPISAIDAGVKGVPF